MRTSHNVNTMVEHLGTSGKIPSQKYFPFARSYFGEDLLEDFLVAAVASLLLLRLYLFLTGFPQVSFSNIHIAHMLWGGLLMLVAIFISLGFLSRPAHEWAAILGGIGFGAFIDELGKFLTQDNNYFFQPAIAIIYVLFVLIYLSIRVVFNRRPLTRSERLANAFELVQQGSINGLNKEEKTAILDIMDLCDQNDPLVGSLREMLPNIKIVPSRGTQWMNRLRDHIDDFYHEATARWWFAGVVIAFFSFTAVTGFSAALGAIERPWSFVLAAAALIIILLGFLQVLKGPGLKLQILFSGGIIAITLLIIWIAMANRQQVILPFADWALFICSSVSGVLIVAGVVLMGWSRLFAYQMFRLAVLISLLLTSVFAFYAYQFYALIGVLLNTLILYALRYMINREKLKKAQSSNSSDNMELDIRASSGFNR